MIAFGMGPEDPLHLVRETVRLLEAVALKQWPSFEFETLPYKIESVGVGSPEFEATMSRWRQAQKEIDNDLGLQAGRVRASIEEVRLGRTPAFLWPDAPMRVAILLRKLGEKDLEQRFLTAFLRRFPNGVGAKHRLLIERLDKLSPAANM